LLPGGLRQAGHAARPAAALDGAAGVEQLYRAFKEHGLEHEDLTGSRFQRVAHIKSLMADGLLDGNLRVSQTQPQPDDTNANR
jgi:hypothetical protein